MQGKSFTPARAAFDSVAYDVLRRAPLDAHHIFVFCGARSKTLEIAHGAWQASVGPRAPTAQDCIQILPVQVVHRILVEPPRLRLLLGAAPLQNLRQGAPVERNRIHKANDVVHQGDLDAIVQCGTPVERRT
eukprot:scaffold5138_cov251-Pinguiococcus_pyrenoidosus.AAC.12